jgi:hypothetical protein
MVKKTSPWMVLDSKHRGILEKEIDNTIQAIPIFVKKYRDITMKARLQYRDEADFVLGFACGKIIFTYIHNFWIKNRRFPSKDEVEDMHLIIERRIREIKEAIFRTG